MKKDCNTTSHLDTGKQAEDRAILFLEKKGLQLIQRNWRAACGEIDAIMRDRDTTVFVEVRFRKNTLFGNGADTVTRSKQNRLINTAMLFMQQDGKAARNPCRFDIISIDGNPQNGDIQWIPNAFEVS